MSASAARANRRRIKRVVEGMATWAASEVERRRELDPTADYATRLYSCEFCDTLNAAVAPRDELVDFYGCPNCGMPSTALASASSPPSPRATAKT